jgi:ferredoxin--NADP+ reductase
VDSIHPKKDELRFEELPQLYIDPVACIGCGACLAVCPTESVFVLEDLPPDRARFARVNAAYYA